MHLPPRPGRHGPRSPPLQSPATPVPVTPVPGAPVPITGAGGWPASPKAVYLRGCLDPGRQRRGLARISRIRSHRHDRCR